MFSLYINLAYYIPHVYLFFRVKDNFISKRYKFLYVIVYLLLASIYPVVGRHSDRSNLFNTIFAEITNYLLPFYLYLFLFVLLYDFLLLANLLLKVVSSEKRRSFRFRAAVFSLILFLSAGVVVYGAINLNTIRISEFKIETPKGNSDLESLRIAFVADAHFEEGFPLDFVEQFVTKVNKLDADILLMGGDIVEGGRINGGMEKTENLLLKIKTKYGIYSIYGNHEGYGRRNPEFFFQRSGITLLKDRVIKINNSFYLAGRLDQQYRRRKSADDLISKDYSDIPVILLDHRPTQLQEASLTTADLQFSGHTHNGQLFPLNLFINNMYELAWGYKKIRDTHFFVTSGLRLWGPPVKTSGKSEIVLVDLKFKERL